MLLLKGVAGVMKPLIVRMYATAVTMLYRPAPRQKRLTLSASDVPSFFRAWAILIAPAPATELMANLTMDRARLGS